MPKITDFVKWARDDFKETLQVETLWWSMCLLRCIHSVVFDDQVFIV